MDETKDRLASGSLFGFFQTLMMAFAMIIPSMYFSSLDISIATYAFLLSIGDVFSFLIKPTIGILTDRHGERRYLLIGGFLFVFSLFLIGQTTSVLSITILKILSGVASAMMFVIILIYSLRLVKDKPDQKVGMFGGVYNTGWIVGLLIPGFFVDFFGIKPVFYLILAVGLLWVFLMFRFAKTYKKSAPAQISFLYMKKIPHLIILKTMDLAMFSAFVFYFTRYALETLDLSRSVVSSIAATEVLFFAVSIFLIGRISKASLRKYWVPLCIIFHLIAACIMVSAVVANSLLLYYLVGICIGIAGGFIDIWIYSRISELFESTEKGKVIGTLSWSYDLATICGAQIPLLFITLGFETFASLFVFPMVILVTFIISKKASLV